MKRRDRIANRIMIAALTLIAVAAVALIGWQRHWFAAPDTPAPTAAEETAPPDTPEDPPPGTGSDTQETDEPSATGEPTDGQSADGQSADGQSADGQSADGQSVGGQSTDGHSAGHETASGRTGAGQSGGSSSSAGETTTASETSSAGTETAAQPAEPSAPASEPEQPPAYTCSITIRCDSILSHMDQLSPAKAPYVPSDGLLLSTSVTFTEGETVFNVLRRACQQAGLSLEYSWTPAYNSYYVEGIGQLYEFDCGAQSGWTYQVNGISPSRGCSDYALQNGDSVAWLYTCGG